MEAVPSGAFLEEFTIIANRAHDEHARFLVERKNGKHVIVLSLADYNDLLKERYQANKEKECPT